MRKSKPRYTPPIMSLTNGTSLNDFVIWRSPLALILIGFWFVATAPAQEPQVVVELTQPRIFEGESVRLYVTLNGFDDTAQPKLADIPDIMVQAGGVNQMRMTVNINGRVMSSGGPRYDFILTPRKAGDFEIPGPTVELGGKTFRGESVRLRVMPPNEQDLALLAATVDRAAVYPMQPFTLRLTIAVKELPEPFEKEDPLRGATPVPVLRLPWADDEELPDGVEPSSPASNWVREILVQPRRRERAIGFGLNNLTLQSDDLFSMFSPDQRAVFRPTPRETLRDDRQGRKTKYWEYTFERQFTAKKLGKLVFGPIQLKGEFAGRVSASGEVEAEPVYALARPIEVDVRDVPANGRPASYVGAVGKFEVAASLSPSEAKVGDPMTFALRVFGTGTLENAVAPKLSENADVAGLFKVYEATEESDEGEKRFTYSLRPLKAGIQQFPALEVAYFDFAQEKYVALRTAPIPVKVVEADRLATSQIAGAVPSAHSAQKSIEAQQGGIFANITDLRQVRDDRIRPESYLLSLVGMAGLFVVVSVVTQRVRTQRGDPSRVRRRLAVRRLRERLLAARPLLESAPRDGLEAVSGALVGLVADATGRSETSLTSRDVHFELTSADIDATLIDRVVRLLDQRDAARYGAGITSPRTIAEEADALAELLVEALQGKGRIG